MRHYLNTAFHSRRIGKAVAAGAILGIVVAALVARNWMAAWFLACATIMLIMAWYNVELVDILRRINRLDAHRHQIATSALRSERDKAIWEKIDVINTNTALIEAVGNTTQSKVTAMCTAFGQDVHEELHEPSAKVRGLRIALLTEEYKEYLNAEQARDIVEIADALGDMTVIIYGTAAAYGIDLDSVVAEIHRSNMTKLDADGNVIRREDGKIMKPDTYEPPQLADIIGYDETGPWSDGQEAAA